jgi:hypothetical protein
VGRGGAKGRRGVDLQVGRGRCLAEHVARDARVEALVGRIDPLDDVNVRVPG